MRSGFSIQVITWENSIYPDAGLDGQDVINRQVGYDYDLFVGILWDRVGTETKRAESGTIEEYERAMKKHLVDPSVKVMMYFKQLPPEVSDAKNREKLLKFRKRVEQEGCFYKTFTDSEEFSRLLYDNLLMVLAERASQRPKQIFVRDYQINYGDAGSNGTYNIASLAMIHKNSVLITQRSHRLKVGFDLWQLPGGKTEPGENPQTTVLREIREELGIELAESDLHYLTAIKTELVGGNEGRSALIHLFCVQLSAKIDTFVLEDSIQRLKWIKLSELDAPQIHYLGDNRRLLEIVRRYQYAYLPLQRIRMQMQYSQSNRMPARIDPYSIETSQVLLTLLDVMGFLGSKTGVKNTTTDSLLKVLQEWCMTDGSIFEDEGSGEWKNSPMLLNHTAQIESYREGIFEHHEALSALMSYKLERVFSRRRVCDLLVFFTIFGEHYLLMRWDFWAKKYQIPARGLEGMPSEYPDADAALASARYVASERFSKTLSDALIYHNLGSFQTVHLSSGSIHTIPFVREYSIQVVFGQIKPEDIGLFLTEIAQKNRLSASLMDSNTVASSTKRAALYYKLVKLEDILTSPNSFRGKQVQGVSELIDFWKPDTFRALASAYSVDITSYLSPDVPFDL